LDLALALIGRPQLVFLDEPTTGFDPEARRTAWDTIRQLKADGATIVLTTHYLEEADALADRVVVVAAGVVVTDATPSALRDRDSDRTRITFRVPIGVPLDSVPTVVNVVDGVCSIETAEPTKVLAVLTSWAVDGGFELGELDVRRPTLEDVYLELTA
jgi:ABC-2 type transport system ATP-binding protein